jgi:hypothetical protein
MTDPAATATHAPVLAEDFARFLAKLGPDSPPTDRRRNTRPPGPLGNGWDWDRRGRTAWLPIETRPAHAGYYEVRGAGIPERLRYYAPRGGWDYKPAAGDEWRGLVKPRPMTAPPYRPKRYDALHAQGDHDE